MSVLPGTRVGAYEIVSALGAGGMGQVFRARDTRLNRDVALKVLPDAFAHDPDRLARFTREAQTLAALNHPNIAHIHGLEESGGVHALVMELAHGEDLSVALARGPVPVPQAVSIARQMAEALDAAHEQGIVHRDLKPANIKVGPDGTVKLLDFGLAKAFNPAQSGEPGNASGSTLTSPAMTAIGMILGTAGYMAPEQARGKPVDKRADIWAFGVVLYEMLTGRCLFTGDTVTDVVAQVLTQPIAFDALPADTPVRVRELIARCLDRDPRRRLRDMGDARAALDVAADREAVGPSGTAAAIASASPGRARPAGLPWAIALTAGLAALALAVDHARLSRAAAAAGASTPLVLEIGPPPEGAFLVGSNVGAVIVSPDGSKVAFFVQTAAGPRLFVRVLATGETHAVTGVVDASYPFWSPDSRRIGYFGLTRLYTVDLAGGLPEAIADIQQGRGGTWTENGTILYTPVGGGTIYKVDARGGPATPVTALDESRGENAHYWPVALPGGRRFLYFVRSRMPENNGIYLGTVDGSAKPVRLVTSLSSALYSPAHGAVPGRLLWVRDGHLLAQAMDPDTGALTGEIATLADDVRVEESQRGTFASVANNGMLVWASAQAADFQMASFDREGRRLNTLAIAPGKIMQPRISPDDRLMSFTRATNGTADIFTYDFSSKEVQQVTTDPDYDESGMWSPDSRRLFHAGRRDETLIAAVDHSRSEQVVSRSDDVTVGCFSHDGSAVLVVRAREKDIALIRLSDPGTLIPVTPDPGTETTPALSPDGAWLAFVSDRSGRPEIVLAPYHDDGHAVTLGAQRIPVSAGGGADPHWRRDGREIVYAAPDATLRAVSVTTTGGTAATGRPETLPITASDAVGIVTSWATNSTHTLFVVTEAPRATRQTFRVLIGR